MAAIIPKPPAKAPPAVNYAQVLCAFGERLFGGEYAADLGRVLSVDAQVVRRVRQAAAQGKDHRAARDLLARLHGAFAPIMAELKPWSDYAADD